VEGLKMKNLSMTAKTPSFRAARPARECGVSLIFALVALMALSLAAVGLVRTVNTSSLVTGNVGFKIDATASADRGAALAIAWLQGNVSGAVVENNVPASGYYATSLDALDPTGSNTTAAARAVVDWDADDCAGVSGDYTACLEPGPVSTIENNSVRWIITRLCAATGSPSSTNSCATSSSLNSGEDANSGGLTYSRSGGFGQSASSSPYYRIIVRSVGGRKTVSYTETMIHF
jgi:type IV pilus assembly protein PilX